MDDGHLYCTKTIITNNNIEVNPSYTIWVQQNNILMSTLMASFSIQVSSLINGCTISHLVWIFLASILAFISTTCIIYMHSTLIELCKKHDDNVVTYKMEKLIVMNSQWLVKPLPFRISIFIYLKDFMDNLKTLELLLQLEHN